VLGTGFPTEVDDQIALFALAGDDHVFVVPASFENRFQTVEAEAVLGALCSVAINAVGLEDGLNVFGEGDAFLGGGWRQLGEVNGEGRGGGSQARDGREADGGCQVLISHGNLSHSNVWP
jgi:hypothetical protein